LAMPVFSGRFISLIIALRCKLFNEGLDYVILKKRSDRRILCRFFPFTEPVLSAMRFFAALRMTVREGFRVRMTNGIAMLRASTRYDSDNPKRKYITEVQYKYT